MTPPDLIIFDCDGVLIDSEILAGEIYTQALAGIGIRISVEEERREFVGLSRASVAAKIETRYKIKLTDGFWDDMRAQEFKTFKEKLKPIPGAVDFVKAVKNKKCVASSNGPQTLKFTLGLVGLWDSFAPNIFSALQVKNGKPAPDLFVFAAKQMGAEAASCLVIEDSIAGVRAAKAANMRVFGFAGGSHCGPEHANNLKNEGAEEVFVKMHDIADVLLP